MHRIGRTGRAGRKGEAILFIAPRERNMLRAIERATRQEIEQMNLPSPDAVNAKRIAKFRARVTEALAAGDTDIYKPVLEQLEAETGVPLIDIAAALARLAQGATPLLLASKSEPRAAEPAPEARAGGRPDLAPRPSRGDVDHRPPRPERSAPLSREEFYQKETYRIAVGEAHGVRPGNIVGAIANEADIEGVHIGRVDIREDHSFVDLPGGMPKAIFDKLQTVRIAGRELRLTRVTEKPPKPPKPRKVLKRS